MLLLIFSLHTQDRPIRCKQFVLSVKPKEIRKTAFLSKADYVSGCWKCEELIILEKSSNLSTERENRRMQLRDHKEIMIHQRNTFKNMKVALKSSECQHLSDAIHLLHFSSSKK